MYIIFSLKRKVGRDIFLDDLDCNYSTIVENCNLELDGIGILKNSISMLTANYGNRGCGVFKGGVQN